MPTSEEQAIYFSICGDWKNAIAANLAILKKNPTDIDALNRLTYAYIQIGKYSLAKKTINIILAIDPSNVIANKNLSCLKNNSDKFTKTQNILENNVSFIENPGLTRIITLIYPTNTTTISKIRHGAKLSYKIRKRKIWISYLNEYIGCFPDDLSKKYIQSLTKGKKYEAFFKSYQKKKVTVLFKEN